MISPNDEQLILSCHPSFQPYVRQVMEKMQELEWLPKILYAWRSKVAQGNLLKAGNSTVSFGFHNATYPDGRPAALAVDIIDKRYAWSGQSSRDFFADLLRVSHELGLIVGSDWNGNGIDDRDEKRPTTIYDAAHVQFFTCDVLKKVRAGWLPPDDFKL